MPDARSRQFEESEATRRALVDSARRRFGAQGYVRTSLDEITRGIDVTKGALYHHFDGKASLFEAVLEAVEKETQQRILAAYQGGGDAWQGALAGLDVFLAACSDTDYGRLVFVEGPVALGWGRWREYEEKYGYGLTEGLVRALMASGDLQEGPLQATTTAAFGMLGHVGLALAEAEPADRPRMKAEFRDVIARILTGLRPATGRRRLRRG